MTSRKYPSAAFWATVVVVVVLVAYPLSFGPALWLADRFEKRPRPFAVVYWPIGRMIARGPCGFVRLLNRYSSMFADKVDFGKGDFFSVPVSPANDWEWVGTGW